MDTSSAFIEQFAIGIVCAIIYTIIYFIIKSIKNNKNKTDDKTII